MSGAVRGPHASRMSRQRRRRTLILFLTMSILTIGLVGPAPTQAGHTHTRPFEPTVLSPARYAVREPAADPALQRHVLPRPDGPEIWTETWLPVDPATGAAAGPVPTVLVATPYMWEATYPDLPGAGKNYMHAYFRELGAYLIERGYAYTQMHLRGTGESTGCANWHGQDDVDDIAAVVEYLGRDAPWSDGTVAALGLSATGGSAVAVAARGVAARTYLKAIVAAAPASLGYSYHATTGVPYGGITTATFATQMNYWAGIPEDQLHEADVATYAGEWDCHEGEVMEMVDLSGNFSEFDSDREHRLHVSNVSAAVLLFQGLADDNVKPDHQVGLFNRLPATTPRAAVIGQFDHVLPEEDRADVHAMVASWLDRYLKGLPTNVESWPTVQLQDTDGRWRAEPDWPDAGGPAGQLALGSGGTLGATVPMGSSVYVEGQTGLSKYDATISETTSLPTSLVFTTPALPERLHLTGRPVLDLSVAVDRPDAHIAVDLQVLDADGNPIESVPGEFHRTWGARSVQHLDPLVDDVFVQASAKLPAPNTQLPIQIPLQPAELVVPKGGRLRLTISGSTQQSRFLHPGWHDDAHPASGTLPSGAGAIVTVTHDCEHPSVLRFLTPGKHPKLLDVREPGEDGPLGRSGGAPLVSDGGGMVSKPVCGRAPSRPTA